MADLKATLQNDLTAAMRAHDEVTVATIRMALTAITNEEVAGKEHRELSDDDVVGVLGREAKKRRESQSEYAKAGRTDLADREGAELEVLARYLPAPLSDEEVASMVAAAVAEAKAAGFEGMKAMGPVMKTLTPAVAGRADGAAVAAAVRAALGA
jgi:uncharacterized protein YqeY